MHKSATCMLLFFFCGVSRNVLSIPICAERKDIVSSHDILIYSPKSYLRSFAFVAPFSQSFVSPFTLYLLFFFCFVWLLTTHLSRAKRFFLFFFCIKSDLYFLMEVKLSKIFFFLVSLTNFFMGFKFKRI